MNALYEGRDLIFDAFKSEISPIKETQGKWHLSDLDKWLKTLTPKQMLQRLLIALAQVEAGNTSEKLLNEIRQTIYSLYRAEEITKKVFNNTVNSIKAW